MKVELQVGVGTEIAAAESIPNKKDDSVSTLLNLADAVLTVAHTIRGESNADVNEKMDELNVMMDVLCSQKMSIEQRVKLVTKALAEFKLAFGRIEI